MKTKQDDAFFVVTTTPVVITFLIHAKDELEAKEKASEEIGQCYFDPEYCGDYIDGGYVGETEFQVFKLPPKSRIEIRPIRS